MAKKPSKPARKSRPAPPPPPPVDDPALDIPPPPSPEDDGLGYITLGPKRKLPKTKEAELIRTIREHGGHLWDVVVNKYEQAQRQRGCGPNNMLQKRKLVVGIKMPSLLMEYLLGVNCFPLMLIMQIVGEPHSGKSGLVAEICRWFDEVSGGGRYYEAESKHSPDWFASIMGWEAYHRFIPLDENGEPRRCDSIEDWQEHLYKDLVKIKRVMDGTKEEPGVGRSMPVLFAVDSVMGKPSRRTQHKIEKEGSADLTRPWDASIITTWLRANSHLLSGWPFSLVLTNHLKYGQDENGDLERRKAGGSHISFQETVELQLDRWQKKLACADWEGRQCTLSIHKNSLAATDGFKANVRYLWWYENDPETGGVVQKTIWDWNHGTVELLNYLMHSDSGHHTVFFRNRLKDAGFHIDCPSVAPVENKAWSKNLGMKPADAVSWNELGQAIAADASLMKLLRDALAIRQYPYLTGDIRELLTAQAKEAE